METESHSTFLMEFHTQQEKFSSPDGTFVLLVLFSVSFNKIRVFILPAKNWSLQSRNYWKSTSGKSKRFIGGVAINP